MPESNICIVCGKLIKSGRVFCSIACKGKSQEKRITLACDGCSRSFSIWPCFKRKNNYCSVTCYRDTTRRKEMRECKVCGKEFLAKSYLIKRGFGIFCSRECQHKTYPERVVKNCLNCDNQFSVWPSHAHLAKFCSKECADDFKRDYVDLVCKNCEKPFKIPRWELNRGRGTFCTRECFIKFNGESSLEEKMRKVLTKAKIKFLQEYKFGRFRADFLLTDLKTVVECDGEFWHMSSKAKSRDARKDEYLKKEGYKVIRMTGTNINNYSEKKLIERILIQ